MAGYIQSLVAVTLLRESLAEPDRDAVAAVARRYVELRGEHRQMMERMEPYRRDFGLQQAEVLARATAEFVARTFEGDLPDHTETHVIDEHADKLVPIAVQAVFDLMEHDLRQRFKNRARLCARLARPPLNEEVAVIVDLLDSWEAWELEQRLEYS